MKERQKSALRPQYSMQAFKYSGNQLCREIVRSVPKENYVEVAARKVQAGLHESVHVVLFARVSLPLPLRLIRILYDVRHIHAVAERGQKVDIRGRSRPKVQHAQAVTRLQISKCIGPPARRTYPVCAVPTSSLRAILAESAEHP